MKKTLWLLMFLPLLTGCATAIPSIEMLPNARTYTYLDSDMLKNNMMLGTISLSEKMPTSGFIITATEFKKVLQMSLMQAGWANGSDKARYVLDAHFVEQQIPFSLFNSKVISVVDYTLNDRKNGDAVYTQRVTIPCVVKFAEQINADMRVLKARECAVGENVTHVLRDLNNKF